MNLGAKPPIGSANIAKPIPLAEADPQRQAVYTPLIAALNAERAADGKEPDPGSTAPEPELPPWTPDAEDKKNFTRALLGGRQYEKVYVLFGGLVKVTLLDRTAQQAESLYNALREDMEMTLFPAADLALWEARYHLAATLRKLEMNDRAPLDLDFPTKFKDRVIELMEHNSSPLYQALMSVSDTFERHINLMIENARNDSFWQTGGTVSQ